LNNKILHIEKQRDGKAARRSLTMLSRKEKK